MCRFITVLLLLCSYFVLSAQSIIGRWRGELNIEDLKLEILFNIEQGDTSLMVKIDIPAQGVKDVVLDPPTYRDGILDIYVEVMDFRYIGEYSNGFLLGKIYLGEDNYDLNMIRDHQDTAILRRYQEPVPPYPYDVKEFSYGTLTIPKGKGRYPAVVLINDSGERNRDGEMFQHKPLLVIADFLSRNGYAVFRYDSRDDTPLNLSKDVISAIDIITKTENVDNNRVGVLGLGEGGFTAFISASIDKRISFLITLAAPGLSGADNIIYQYMNTAKKNNFSKNIIDISLDLYDEQFALIEESDSVDIRLKRRLSLMYINRFGNALSEEEINNRIESLLRPVYYNYIKTDPYIYISSVSVPVLALYGSMDNQIIPYYNIPAIEEALAESNSKNYTVIEIDGVNHLFQECLTGDIIEYLTIDQTISPYVLNLILEWLKSL